MDSTECVSSHDEPVREHSTSRRRLCLVAMCCVTVGLVVGFGAGRFTAAVPPVPDEFEIKSAGFNNHAVLKINKRTGETWLKNQNDAWVPVR